MCFLKNNRANPAINDLKIYNIYIHTHANIMCKMKTLGNLPLPVLRFQSRGDQQRPKRHAPFPQESHLWGKLPQVETKYCSRGTV